MFARMGAAFSRLGLVVTGHGVAGGGGLGGGTALQADFSVNTTESWFFY